MSADDQFVFAEETTGSDDQAYIQPELLTWKILIVDDEEDVHSATKLALQREEICERPLSFLHAYTAGEATALLEKHHDIAVILLDVVMESEHAGLNLVQKIRQDKSNQAVRIILRTGQPGYAPELDTIKLYEINDYRAKSELTRNKLYTCITTAIRSYSQIKALELSKKGLESIIIASKELLYLRGFREFATGVITQIAGIFQLPDDGLVCVKKGESENEDDLVIIAATGRHSEHLLKPVAMLQAPNIISPIEKSAQERQNLFEENYTCLYFETPDNAEMVVYLATGMNSHKEMMQLLELFSTNICAGIDNVLLLEQRHKYAYSDPMLGIPNRLSFLQAIDSQLNTNVSDQNQIALIDIDQFGALNDTIGTDYGDRLLKQISERLQRLPGDILVARISGDTFGLLGNQQFLKPDTLASVFDEPYEVEGSAHNLSATQGRVRLNTQNSATDLLAQANVALKRAKQTLRGSYLDFHSDMLKETESRVHLLQNLRQAFDHERLFMVYQPKIDLRTGKLIGFEALMRWKNDEGNYVPPLDFIPIAESSGLIVPLGEWALKASLVKLCQVRQNMNLDVNIAVNVSMVQFAQPNFLETVDNAILFAGAKPEWLELEITESVAMHDTEKVRELIAQLYKRGIRISIDDFGTGFSSLNYLEQLKVHCLKIDKSFIDRIDEHDIDTRIPETILRLGQVLNLDVVAEGIENEFQAQWLKQNGCQLGQGFHYSRPIPRDQLEAWISDYQKKESEKNDI